MGLKHNAQNMPQGGNSTPVTQFVKSGGVLLITPSEKKHLTQPWPQPTTTRGSASSHFSCLGQESSPTHGTAGSPAPCLCAKGGCFAYMLRACSSLGCSSRRHPWKQQPRGLPVSPIFWKEQPCKIRRALLSCLPSLSVIIILNKMNECHTLS